MYGVCAYALCAHHACICACACVYVCARWGRQGAYGGCTLVYMYNYTDQKYESVNHYTDMVLYIYVQGIFVITKYGHYMLQYVTISSRFVTSVRLGVDMGYRVCKTMYIVYSG